MRIENANLCFEYPDKDTPHTAPSVTNLRTGAVFELAVRNAPNTMWRAELRDAVGWCQLVDSKDVLPSCEIEEDAAGASFVLRWRGVPVPAQDGTIDCEVRGELATDSDQVLMWAAISINSERYALWEFSFPYWQAVCPKGVERGDWHVFLPMGHGEIIRDPAHSATLNPNEFRETYGVEPEGWRVYPAGGTSMQCGAVVGKDAMLYLGTRDPAPERKMFRFLTNEPHEAVELSITHYPALDGDGPREYAVPYPVALSTAPGGWHAAAMTYRSWLKETRWARPRAERDMPRWFMEAPVSWLVFFVGDEDIQRTAAEFEEMVEKLPFPGLIHLYNWHQYMFDTLYPDYLPARPGVKEFIERCQAAGCRVMPYINGRICDMNSTVGQEAEAYSVKDAGRLLPLRKRIPRIEHWPSKQKQYPICPATAFWQDKIAEVCAGIVAELGVDGVFLDQVSCVGANRCLDAGHGHPVGAGDFWVRGYETMMEKVRSACAAHGEDLIFTSEGNSENYAHIFDGFVTFNSIAPDTVPGFIAAHNRYAVTIGSMFSAEGVQNGTGFAELLARQVLWGVQIGFFGDAVRRALLQPEHKDLVDMLADAVWVWAQLRDFFYDGEMLDPETFQYVGMGEEWIPGLVRAKDGPVHATAWRLDGRNVVILANISPEHQKGTIRAGVADHLAGRSKVPDRTQCSLKDGVLQYALAPFSFCLCDSGSDLA